MRKLVAAAFVSLDGVIQAPGGPDEDPAGFAHGGWAAPYWDDVVDHATEEGFGRPFDLLLGRKTYDIFAAYWPYIDVDPNSATFAAGQADIANTFNRVTKYVASRSRSAFAWQNSRWLGELDADAAAAVRELKQGDGPDLLTQGSSDFVQTLLAADLIDELRVLIFPVAFGTGKRLFGGGTRPVAFRRTRSVASPSGVLIATYERAGDVGTGSFAVDTPTAAALERRKQLV
jgi:dihydrofolate reductase